VLAHCSPAAQRQQPTPTPPPDQRCAALRVGQTAQRTQMPPLCFHCHGGRPHIPHPAALPLRAISVATPAPVLALSRRVAVGLNRSHVRLPAGHFQPSTAAYARRRHRLHHASPRTSGIVCTSRSDGGDLGAPSPRVLSDHLELAERNCGRRSAVVLPSGSICYSRQAPDLTLLGSRRHQRRLTLCARTPTPPSSLSAFLLGPVTTMAPGLPHRWLYARFRRWIERQSRPRRSRRL
jgi:hypothetical protein